jgi:hypothetical protein
MTEFCRCVSNKEDELGQRLIDIWDEVVELAEVKSWDEFLDEWSDVVFGFGRLLGWFCGVKYVSLWGDERHVRKVEARMRAYGCVRSKRHLHDGKCCSM